MNPNSKRKRVAVIFGGTGLEHSISVMSAQYFCSLLQGDDYLAIPVYIAKNGRWSIHSPKSTPKEIEEKESRGICTYPVRRGNNSGFMLPVGLLSVDAAIPLLHGDGGEDGGVQGALECAGIPYVGATPASSAICHNKAYTKAIAESLGIPTLPWLYTEADVTECDVCELIREAERKLSYPMFIKPATLGSSFGCSAVYSRADFAPAYRTAHKLSHGRVLIEKMLVSPKELEVGYFQSKCNKLFTNPGEILYDGGFYSYEAKYSDTSGARVTPSASITENECRAATTYAEALTTAIGIRHLCRIDFFFFEGKIFFNEINTMPGMTKSSLYPRLIESAGIPPVQMARSLIDAAISRV